MNIIHLLGRIGQDPEVRTVGETSVTKFTLATSERWKNKQGEKQEKTEWHNVESWGKQGEVIAQYFAKGDPILLTGSLVYDKWEDKDGNKRTTAKIKATGFEFVPSSGERQGVKASDPVTSNGQAQQATTPTGAKDESLPF